MTRAKEKAGKLGRADAKEKDTIIPKGREDILREKVQNTGLLSIFGKQKAPGSGISKLFSQSNDVEQAMAGMAGAKLVAGRGAGGLSTSGTGTGGGGTGFGHIYGAGNLDTGGRGAAARGAGPSWPSAASTRSRSGIGAGGGDTDGSLSKEQINKVVKAPPGGREVLLREGAAAQDVARRAASTSSGSSSPTARSARPASSRAR